MKQVTPTAPSSALYPELPDDGNVADGIPQRPDQYFRLQEISRLRKHLVSTSKTKKIDTPSSLRNTGAGLTL